MSDEQAPLLSNDQIEKLRKKEMDRKRDRERKQAERKAKKEAKAAAKEEAALRAQGITPYLGRTAWWESQRLKLTDAQRNELAAREQQVFNMEHWAAEWLAGTYSVDPAETDFYVSLDEGSDIIKEDKARYGVLRYPLLFTETIQVDQDFAEQLRREGPIYPGWGITADELHLRYGWRVALQSPIANHPMFQRFSRPSKCGNCKTDLGTTHLDSNVTVLCDGCELAEKVKTTAAWSKANAWVLERHQRSTPVKLDSWGRR
jgi:hypothetical protein